MKKIFFALLAISSLFLLLPSCGQEEEEPESKLPLIIAIVIIVVAMGCGGVMFIYEWRQKRDID